jgi:phenylacetate-CoA ligase
VANHRIVLLAPVPPPSGGMALQARQLESLLRADGNSVVLVPSNYPFPAGLRFAERIRGLRAALRSLLLWVALWRELGRADILHVLAASWLYFFIVVYPAVLLGWLRGKRIVLNYRGGEAGRFFERYGWLAAPVFALSDVVTAPSRFLMELIGARFGVRVKIVPNILNSSIFRFRARMAFRPKMIISRQLERLYDIETALRAFRLVQQRYPDASLWIAGEGSQKPYLEGLAAEWKLSNVRFLGQVSHHELPAIYDQCDVLLNASLADNFPGSLIEASAAGLAVVTTGVGGIPFVYTHEKSALLVEPGDWNAMAAAVCRVVEEPQLAGRMTTEAAALARGCEWSEVRKSLYRTYVRSADDPTEMEQPCIAG